MRDLEESEALLGGEYCLTSDNLLKMLAIFIRLRVGIPVVLMGECGYFSHFFFFFLFLNINLTSSLPFSLRCGKTALLNYLCAWLEVDFLVLNVHGGTTQQDILDIFEKATRMVTGNEGEGEEGKGGEEEGRVFGGSKVVLGKKSNKRVYVFLDEVFFSIFLFFVS